MPVSRSCVLLGLCERAYYKWRKNPCSAREISDEILLEKIRVIHEKYPGDGYRFITGELVKDGVIVSKNRVHRLCKTHGIYAHWVKKKPTKAPSLPFSCDDLIRRDFTADGPNRKWVIDITEHPTREGTLYHCAIKDLFSNMIVGSISADTMNTTLVTNTVNMALASRNVSPGLILHSDRGGQFHAREYTRLLTEHHIRQSMGNAGTSADNAAMESYFALLQKNVLNLQKTWPTRQELAGAIFYWTHHDYNRRRKQAKLGGHTPTEYETINQAAQAA